MLHLLWAHNISQNTETCKFQIHFWENAVPHGIEYFVLCNLDFLVPQHSFCGKFSQQIWTYSLHWTSICPSTIIQIHTLNLLVSSIIWNFWRSVSLLGRISPPKFSLCFCNGCQRASSMNLTGNFIYRILVQIINFLSLIHSLGYRRQHADWNRL